MKYCLPLLLFFLFSVTNGHASEQDTIILSGNTKQITCDGKETYFFSLTDLPIQTILDKGFKIKKDINLFYVTGWLWVKFTIKNESKRERFVFHTSDGHIAGVYMYKPTLYGYEMTPPKKHHPEDGREIHNRLPSFFIELKKGETQTFYLKINPVNEIVNFSYVIQDEVHYTEYIQTDYIIIGSYFGALLIIIIINIFYFYSLKDSIFLIYALYVLGNFLFTATLDGFTWLLIPSPDIAYHVSFFCIRFWNDSMLFFVVNLVNLRQYNKLLANVAYAYLFYHVVLMAVLDFTNIFNIRETLMAQWEGVNWTICIILALIIIIKSQRNNRYLVKYYIVLFIILISVFIFFLIGHAGKGENYLVFEHGMKVGTFLELITLSFAVSRRFRNTENDLKKKKEEEQQLTDKIKQLEMDVRKAQMNPHFMFNALTSIEYFIFKNASEKARDYLNKFAQLMRITLDNSRSNYVPLTDELQALRFYIELEFLRLKAHNHHFEIKIDPVIHIEKTFVPALLIQPFVENAIWHGLQKKEAPGTIFIELRLGQNNLECIVKDDGGGVNKEAVASNRKSSGIQITKERLQLIHTIQKTIFQFNISDVKNESGGTIGTCVSFNIPYKLE